MFWPRAKWSRMSPHRRMRVHSIRRSAGVLSPSPCRARSCEERDVLMAALADYLQAALARAQSPIEGADGAVAPEQLLARARAIAGELVALKISPAEPVLATFSNHPADLAAMLGIWLAGGVVVPLHAAAAARTAEGLQ